MAEHNPAVRRFVRIPQQPDGSLDATVLQTALDHGFCIVRWHLAEQG